MEKSRSVQLASDYRSHRVLLIQRLIYITISRATPLKKQTGTKAPPKKIIITPVARKNKKPVKKPTPNKTAKRGIAKTTPNIIARTKTTKNPAARTKKSR